MSKIMLTILLLITLAVQSGAQQIPYKEADFDRGHPETLKHPGFESQHDFESFDGAGSSYDHNSIFFDHGSTRIQQTEQAPEDQYFDDRFFRGGFDGPVETSIMFDGELYVGGSFNWFNGQTRLNRVSRWDAGTESWQPLGEGFNGTVLVLAEFEGELYAGGNFTHSGIFELNGITRWDAGSDRWIPLSDGFSGGVNAMAEYNGELYAAGENVARWNGETEDWISIGEPGVSISRRIHALIEFEGELYAGGRIYNDHISIGENHIFKWDAGSKTWHLVGEGFYRHQNIKTLKEFKGELYAGGSSKTIHRWDTDSGTWQTTGGGSQNIWGTINTLAEYNGELYAGGSFSMNDSSLNNRFARLDADSLIWVPLDEQKLLIESPYGARQISTLAPFDDKLFIGGDHFDYEADEKHHYASLYDGESKTALGEIDMTGEGFDGSVYALTEFEGDVIAGGAFNLAGSLQADGIVRWDAEGETWQLMGEQLSGTVFDFIEFKGELYAGGGFMQSGDQTSASVIRWDPGSGSWRSVGGFFGHIYAMNVYNDELYAAGTRITFGDASVNHIARWDADSESWQPVGEGFYSQDEFSALSVYNEELYAGGEIIRENYLQSYIGIVRLDDNSEDWQQIEKGFSHAEYTLSVLNGELYAGGEFTHSGETELNGIARWDAETETWRPVGEGFRNVYRQQFHNADNPLVLSLIEHNGSLYAGGLISHSGNTEINGIARFNRWRNEWEPLGSGIIGMVRDMVESDDLLFVAGSFRTAGGKRAYNITTWDAPEPPPFILVDVRDVPDNQGYRVTVEAGGQWFDDQSEGIRNFNNWGVWMELDGQWTNKANVPWYQDASPIVDVSIPATLPSDQNPDEDSPYTYLFKLTAHGEDGEVIAESDKLLGYARDNIAPPKVQHLAAYHEENHIHFNWSPSSANDLGEYRLFEVDENDQPGSEPVLVTTETEDKIRAPEKEGEYRYTVKAVDIHANAGEHSDAVKVAVPTGRNNMADLPQEYELKQNYPNPFNPVTQISYSIPESAHVSLEVFNALGQRVATLVNEYRSPGIYEATFDAGGLSSGLYIYRLHTESYSESNQMLLVK